MTNTHPPQRPLLVQLRHITSVKKMLGMEQNPHLQSNIIYLHGSGVCHKDLCILQKHSGEVNRQHIELCLFDCQSGSASSES